MNNTYVNVKKILISSDGLVANIGQDLGKDIVHTKFATHFCFFYSVEVVSI